MGGDATVGNTDRRYSLCAGFCSCHASITSLSIEQAKAVMAVSDLGAIEVEVGDFPDLHEKFLAHLFGHSRNLIHGKQEGRQPNGRLPVDDEEVVDHTKLRQEPSKFN